MRGFVFFLVFISSLPLIFVSPFNGVLIWYAFSLDDFSCGKEATAPYAARGIDVAVFGMDDDHFIVCARPRRRCLGKMATRQQNIDHVPGRIRADDDARAGGATDMGGGSFRWHLGGEGRDLVSPSRRRLWYPRARRGGDGRQQRIRPRSRHARAVAVLSVADRG